MARGLIPRPAGVLVCMVCGQPWSAHLALAEADAVAGMWHSIEGEVEVSPEEVLAAVSIEHCVELLKRTRRGPPGPPGPVGATGAQGVPGGLGRDLPEKPPRKPRRPSVDGK